MHIVVVVVVVVVAAAVGQVVVAEVFSMLGDPVAAVLIPDLLSRERRWKIIDPSAGSYHPISRNQFACSCVFCATAAHRRRSTLLFHRYRICDRA